MYLPEFKYYSPDTLSEACQLLRKHGTEAKILAGGTDLLHKMKHQEIEPAAVVALRKLQELKQIEYRENIGLVIGAAATQNDITNSPVIGERYRSICEAAHHMANNQIRNRGTVGGNIVNAVPSADLPPILIALGASVKLVSMDGERIVLLEDIFQGVHRTVIRQDEILTHVIVPDQKFTGSTFIRFGLRRSGALAVAGAAVAVEMDGDICRDARIVLAAAAPIPMRASNAEKILIGQKISDELLEEAGVAASKESKPRSSIRGSEEYRRDLIRVLTRRALAKAIKEGHI